MPDREKVIKGMECCIGQFPGEDYCKTCAYQPYRFGKCKADAITDALALLKEQEAKTGKWILDDEDANSWECSECGGLLLINDGTPHENDWYFCPYCGSKLEEQAVKLDDND